MKRHFMVAGMVLAASSTAGQAADVAQAPAGSRAQTSCKATLSAPAFNGPITQNPTPGCISVPGFGDLYIGGAITGYAYTETNPFASATSSLPSDASSRADFSNLQVFLQKADGPVQFFLQAGAYAIPSLGVANFGTLDQTSLLFGALPVAYGKIPFSDDWSIEGGRLPTLIGSEAPFTFQNLTIERGLLFNQENVINQGVQVNYAHGPWSASLAGTDGFYSGELSWFTGSVSFKIDEADTIEVNGGLNLGRTDVLRRSVADQYVTPLAQQNSGIVDLNYTFAKGAWTVTPYVQFTNVEQDPRLGIAQGASTLGGAVLASYAFTDHWALAGRLEYEGQSGRRGSDTTSLLYGPGSSAFSATITPTYTIDRFFARAEYAHVELFNAAPGLAFGRDGRKTSQDRFMAETGIVF